MKEGGGKLSPHLLSQRKLPDRCSDYGSNVQELNQIVSEINELDVPAEDRLSNHVYCYSPLEDQIFIPSCPSSASASSGIWNPQ